MALINVDSWSVEFDAVDKLASSLKSQLSSRNPQNFYSLSATLRIMIKQANNEVNQLEANLKELGSSQVITKDEEERRLRKLEQLQSKLIQIEKEFNKKPGDEERQQLMMAPSSSRGLWEGEDEEILDNNVPIENIINEHQQILANQDDQLDNLANLISRQKQVAIKIGEEVETHNDILDQLGSTMENVDSRVQTETRHVERVGRRDNTCGYWVVIISLFVAIIVVGIL